MLDVNERIREASKLRLHEQQERSSIHFSRRPINKTRDTALSLPRIPFKLSGDKARDATVLMMR